MTSLVRCKNATACALSGGRCGVYNCVCFVRILKHAPCVFACYVPGAPFLDNKFSALSMAEAEEDTVDAPHVDRVDINTTPNLLVNISDVKWLPSDALQKGVLPLKINGTEKNYKVSNETELSPTQNCVLPGDGSTSGVCRHFANCVLEQVVQRIEDFVKYQCSMGDYLAICCPPDAIRTNSGQTTASPQP